MATAKELDSFIKSLQPQTDYLESGFDRFFDRNLYRTRSRSAADFNAEIESISFNRINQGIATSSRGKMKIDFEKGLIIISDGSLDRVLIGDLGDE